MTDAPKHIYKILTRAEAESAGEAFTGAPVDVADGFIHFSTAGQVAETLAKHFTGQAGLVLLRVDTEALEAARPGKLVWEPSRGGALFPHLYADLPMQAVSAQTPLALDKDGVHRLPDAVLLEASQEAPR